MILKNNTNPEFIVAAFLCQYTDTSQIYTNFSITKYSVYKPCLISVWNNVFIFLDH